jgi:YfiH family protein
MTVFSKGEGGYYTLRGAEAPAAGSVGKAANFIDYSAVPERVRRQEKSILRGITGISERRILMLNQLHGDTIVRVNAPPGEDRPAHAEADGMVTTLPGICLVIRTADCVPVIAFDAKRKVLGAVHSGWRGCRLEIARKLIRMMRDEYLSLPEDIRVYILPSIGPRSYAVNDDVAAHFPAHTSRINGRIYLDLWRSIASSVSAAGIPPESIFTSGICTLEEKREFFSHRGGDAGRNLNFAYIPE